MSIKTSPPSTRTTVPVNNEVLAVFQRLAKAGNMSTGKAIAEWLADTVEAAELMAATVERARAAPKLVTAELHAMMLGMADHTKELQDKFSKFKGSMLDGPAPAPFPKGASRAGKGEMLQASPLDAIPPSCNTGGKLPLKSKKSTTKKTGFPLPPALVQAYADTNGLPPKAKK